jgi:alpha 1,3-glucosidase
VIRTDNEPSGQSQPVVFALELVVYQHNILRLKLNEKNPLKPRYEVPDVLLALQTAEATYKDLKLSFGPSSTFSAVISSDPFRLDVFVGDEKVISFNDRNLLQFEELQERQAATPEPAPAVEESEDEEDEETDAEAEQAEEAVVVAKRDEQGAWVESFGSHTDSKPRGPESLGADISFIGASAVYGIPEHASSLALKATRKADGEKLQDPYRLYNLDVFEYELDNTMALYGSVPLMLALTPSGLSTGIFWLNAAESFIDIVHGDQSRQTHWMSESGIIDVFFLLGPKPYDVFKQYASLTGTTPLPQMFSIAYHQCKWNYKDEAEVRHIDEGFDKHNIPMDVIWLDIEHTDGKKYFTWDPTHFPTPKNMLDSVEAKGRKMVTIIDPHIKKDEGYHIYTEAKGLGYFVKNSNNEDYEGWCWPGASYYLDFSRPEVRAWWATKFSFSNYQGSTPALYTWNDMNEPSVFNGPEVSMHKDALHGVDEKWEHRHLHNLYGYYYHWATAEGQRLRSENQNDRPFVLSRAFFAGTQRSAAVWTGDNAAQWSHLAAANPMLLSLGISGITFSGADVGGFFGNPEAELVTRWYQAGAFYPFFRAHAHIDSKRREPWLFGEPHLSVIRSAIRTRYALLPYWYSVFYQHSQTGLPVLRPMWVEFPKDTNAVEMEDQFLIGRDILVKPVTAANQLQTIVYLPSEERWYDYETGRAHGGAPYHTIDTPLAKMPVFQRGGSVLVRKDRPRRSTTQMKDDPYTLVVALNGNGAADGELYVDDGKSYDYQTKNAYLRRNFRFQGTELTSTSIGEGTLQLSTPIERVVVLGVKKPQKVTLKQKGKADKNLEFEYLSEPGNKVVIRKPDVAISEDWSIVFEASSWY